MPSDDAKKPDKDSDEPETVFDLHPRQPMEPPAPAKPEPQAPASSPGPSDDEVYEEPDYPTRGVPPLMPLPARPKEKPAPEPASEVNRYDFFLEENKQKSKKTAIPLPGGTGGSPFKKIIVVAIGLVVVLVLIGVMLTFLRSGNSGANEQMTSLVYKQKEIVRLSTVSNENLKTSGMKNFALTAKATVTTSQKDLMLFLAERGVKINAKQLAAYTDPENDKVLAAADAADTFDATFKTTMSGLLNEYRASLETLNQGAESQAARDLLTREIESVQLLLIMIDQQS